MKIMNSRVVQWLGLHASTAVGMCSIHGAMTPACHGVRQPLPPPKKANMVKWILCFSSESPSKLNISSLG